MMLDGSVRVCLHILALDVMSSGSLRKFLTYEIIGGAVLLQCVSR